MFYCVVELPPIYVVNFATNLCSKTVCHEFKSSKKNSMPTSKLLKNL
jgi:hypothetical protein